MKNSQLDPRFRRVTYAVDSNDVEWLNAEVDRGLLDSQTSESTESVVSAVGAAAAARSPDSVAGLSASALVRLRFGKPPEGGPTWVWTHLAGEYYTCRVPVNELPLLSESPNVEYAEAVRPMGSALDTSLPEAQADAVAGPDGANLTGDGVIVGVIDFGLDYTLDDFRNPDGSTRVLFLWDQGLTPQVDEAHPDGFDYGVEYDAAAINAALNSSNPFAAVRHVPDPASHGTHVAGIAVGNGRSGDTLFPANQFVGVAPDASIIFVQPRTLPGIGSFTDSERVAHAIRYIFDHANTLNMPCVINMSLGQTEAPTTAKVWSNVQSIANSKRAAEQ